MLYYNQHKSFFERSKKQVRIPKVYFYNLIIFKSEMKLFEILIRILSKTLSDNTSKMNILTVKWRHNLRDVKKIFYFTDMLPIYYKYASISFIAAQMHKSWKETL